MGGSEGITITGHHYFALAVGLQIDRCISRGNDPEFRGNKRLANVVIRSSIQIHLLYKIMYSFTGETVLQIIWSSCCYSNKYISYFVQRRKS